MDSAGSGSSTAYPRATRIHGFHRHDHAFHEPSGPPWIHSSSGAFWSALAPSGSASHARTRRPSCVVVSTSVSVPGSSGVAAGLISAVVAPVARSIRTGCDGASYDDRSAYATRPSGLTDTSVNVASSLVTRVTSSDSRSTPEHRAAAVVVGHHEQAAAVRQPHRALAASGPSSPPASAAHRPPAATSCSVDARRLVRRRERLARERHPPAVRRDDRCPQVRRRVVDEHPVLTGRHVDRDQPPALRTARPAAGSTRSTTVRPSGLIADPCSTSADRASGVTSVSVSRGSLAPARGATTSCPDVRDEQVRRLRAQVVVPVPDRVAVVQDRRDLLVLAGLAQLLVRLGVRRTRQHVRPDQHDVRRPWPPARRPGRPPGPRRRAPRHRPRAAATAPAPARRRPPSAVRVRARTGEQQVARRA